MSSKKKVVQRPKSREQRGGNGQVKKKGAPQDAEDLRHLRASVKKAKMIAQVEGQRGVDPRSSGLTPPDALGALALPQLDHSVDVTGIPDINAIQMLALGPVLAAIKKGWLAQGQSGGVTGAETAFNAWTQLIQAFLNTMQGAFPTVQSAPEWFWQICDAIKPKTVPFKTADASYKMQNIAPLDFVPNSVCSYGSQPNFLVFGIPDASTLVNGMPVLIPVTWGASLGPNALQALFDFFPETLMCKRSGAVQVPFLQKDVSAYAGCYSEWGYDKAGINGIATSLTSEVKITSPILSKLCVYGSERGYTDERRSSGSATYVLPRIMEFTEYRQFHNKAAPIIKMYNFDEYFEILALAVGRALQVANTSSIGTAPLICPLTSQEVQILLRQAMLPSFCNEMAQDLVSQDTVSLTPFSTCINGYAAAGSDMLLPSFLVEMIRATGRKIVQMSAEYPNYQVDFLPVLARSNDISQLGNYNWDATHAVFTENPLEEPVNIIDMSCNPANAGQKFLLAECAVNIEKREEWNQFVHQLESVFAGISPIGTEKGISCLSTLFFSDFCNLSGFDQLPNTPQPPQGKKGNILAKQHSKKQVMEFGTPRKLAVKTTPVPVPGPSEYYQKLNIIHTSTSIAENGVEWKYQKVMPHAFNFAWGDPDSFVSRRQVFNHEGFKISHTAQPLYSGPNGNESALGESVYNKHLAASSYCVRGQLASESEVERDIRVMGEKGRGGFLTSIAGFLAEDVFGIKGARRIAQGVSDLTGL